MGWLTYLRNAIDKDKHPSNGCSTIEGDSLIEQRRLCHTVELDDWLSTCTSEELHQRVKHFRDLTSHHLEKHPLEV